MAIASVILFVGFNLEADVTTWEPYRKWGAPSATDIFNGSYWGLLTSNFLHTQLWHIGFNLYWLWVFGNIIERNSKRLNYIILIVTSGIISSLAQLGFSESTGIGLSGIGYALFGFLFVKSRTAPEYTDCLEQKTITLFLVWLVACFVMTWADVWNVGNAAHVSGMIWGMTIAYTAKMSVPRRWSIRMVLFAVIGTSFLWNPFSISWLSHRAYALHENQKLEEAMTLYEKILKRDSTNEFASTNLAQLKKHQLYDSAYKYHVELNYEKARTLYLEILRIYPDDERAQTNLNLLPNELSENEPE
jgi:GlpG protein